MKKNKISVVLMSIFLFLTLSSLTAFANTTIKINVDNQILNFDTEPFIENGTTLVPMRKIFESLNADVKWVDETKQIIATDDKNYIVLTIGSTIAQRNGTSFNLSVAPKIVKGSTFVPARFIAEALNADVTWDNTSRTVIINSKEDVESQSIVFNDYVPYSTSDLVTLARNLLNGDVIYFDGQYWATPEFASMIANENIVYENDISAGTNQETKITLTPDIEFIPDEEPKKEPTLEELLKQMKEDEEKNLPEEVRQFRKEWIGERELKEAYNIIATHLHNSIKFHRYENYESVTLYTINNSPSDLESKKTYKIDGIEFQYMSYLERTNYHSEGLYFKINDLKKMGLIK